MIIVSCNPVYTKVTATFWEAGGDTSVAWDTKGNAYFDCQVFDRGVPAATNPDMSSGIYVFRSTQNNGASWNFPGHPAAVSSASGQRNTDQWWQWSAFTKAGKLAVSYYDRQYGNDETTGNMDFSLSGSINNPMNFAVVRVTSSSMPLTTQFPDAQGNSLFFGDYTGLDVANNTAYPIWMDTRTKDLALCPGTGAPGVPPQVCTFTEPNGLKANDQEIFMAKVSIP